MVEGNQITVGAKPLHVVDENFCSIPTADANCRCLVYLTSGASAVWYKPAKNKGSGDGVSAASPILKLAKGWRRKKKR